MRAATPFLNLSHHISRVAYWIVITLGVVAALAWLVTLTPIEIMQPGDRFSDAQVRVILGFVTAMMAVTALVLRLLVRLLGDAKRGEIFTARNVARLRAIALMMFASTVVTAMPTLWEDSAPLDWRIVSTLTSVLVGLFPTLVGFALAEVFAQGVALREDAEGTV